jgi:hypothetical protein
MNVCDPLLRCWAVGFTPVESLSKRSAPIHGRERAN